jgi:uncharacterized membrane protein (DUF2068 family)
LAVLIGLLGIGGGALLVLSTNLTLAILSALALVIGVLYIVAGIGFFRGNRWAWILGIGVSLVALVRNSAEIAAGSAAFGIPGIIVAVIIISYLTRPRVKAFFGR